jgi:periodic tryptophan protein 2
MGMGRSCHWPGPYPNPRHASQVSHGKQIQVWNAPGSNKEFAPFVLHRTYTGHYDDVVAIDWSPDSRCVPFPCPLH